MGNQRAHWLLKTRDSPGEGIGDGSKLPFLSEIGLYEDIRSGEHGPGHGFSRWQELGKQATLGVEMLITVDLGNYYNLAKIKVFYEMVWSWLINRILSNRNFPTANAGVLTQ